MSEDFERRWKIECAIRNLEEALALAQVRSLDFKELNQRLATIDECADPSQIIFRLHEIELSKRDEKALVKTLKYLAERAEVSPYRVKAQIERYIKQLLPVLSTENSVEVAGSFIFHHRLGRQRLAFDVFKRSGITLNFGVSLWEKYCIDPRQNYLELIVRSPEVFIHLPFDKIIPAIKEEYWRARAIQILINSDISDLREYASIYPFEFVHAAGRAGSESVLLLIHEIIPQNSDNPDFISILCWYFGKIGDTSGLKLVRNLLEFLKESIEE